MRADGCSAGRRSVWDSGAEADGGRVLRFGNRHFETCALAHRPQDKKCNARASGDTMER